MKRRLGTILTSLIAMLLFSATASGQVATESAGLTSINPISVLEEAARLLPSDGGAVNSIAGTGGGTEPKAPLSTALNIILLLTVLALAPAIRGIL